jgi:predicted glycosyltransferase involved in capsule biosynthesis
MQKAPAILNPKLTVIISVRTSTHYDMIARLRNRLIDAEIPPSVSFLVVDEGSPEEAASKLKVECDALGFEYVRVESNKERFCAATARNFGALAAVAPYIMHEDVDLFPYPGFYKAIVEEIGLQRLEERPTAFITVPAIYLTEAATSSVLEGKITKNAILHDLLTRRLLVKTYLPASSVLVVNRSYYLSIGGYNTGFDGWGLEDLEFAYRLTSSSNSFPPPADYTSLTEKGFATASAYRGWRARFRLHGELVARKGIAIFHAHHPRDPGWVSKERHEANKRLFFECINRFEVEGHFLPPLSEHEDDESGEHIASRETLTSENGELVDLSAPVYDPFRNWIINHQPLEQASEFDFRGCGSEILREARGYMEAGDFLVAAKLFDRMSLLFPDNVSYYRQAAEAYYMGKQKPIAVLRLRRAKTIAPGNKALARRLLQMRMPWLPRRLQSAFKGSR